MSDFGGETKHKGFIFRNLANTFTVLRLLLVPVVVWLISVSSGEHIDGWHYAALFTFIAAAATDFIDGQIARRTDTISEFGKLVDPLADRLLVISVLITLMARSFLPLWMGLVIVSRDILMLVGAPAIGINRQEVREKLAVHWTGKLATALLFTAICIFIMWNTAEYVNHGLKVNTVGFAFFSVGTLFSYLSACIYLIKGINILRERAAVGKGSIDE